MTKWLKLAMAMVAHGAARAYRFAAKTAGREGIWRNWFVRIGHTGAPADQHTHDKSEEKCHRAALYAFPGEVSSTA